LKSDAGLRKTLALGRRVTRRHNRQLTARILSEWPTTRSEYAGGGTALLCIARFASTCPPQMLRPSGMPIKIKDRPFKFGTGL